MKKTKRIALLLLVFVLAITVPATAFANESVPSDGEWVKGEILRVPLTFTPADGSKTLSPLVVPTGYIEFWVEYDTNLPRDVYANWTIVMDSPSTFITAVDVSVYWTGNVFNGGDHWEVFNYPVTPTKTTSNQSMNIYKQSGTYSAIISGGVMTNQGAAWMIYPNLSRSFTFPI